MKTQISFITRLEKKLKVTALDARFEEEKEHFNISIEVSPTIFFLIEKCNWFNLKIEAKKNYSFINRYRSVLLDMKLKEEIVKLTKGEFNSEMNLLQFLAQLPENSPLLQTESWSIYQIRQFLPTINANGEDVYIVNTYKNYMN